MKTLLPVAGAVALASISIAMFAQGRGGGPPAPMPAVLQNYQPVTPERLKNPEAGNWLMIRRTYDGWGYSPLDQITPANVAQLRPVWVFATGEPSVHEAAPMVNNGVMFVSTPNNQVIAIDAKSGNVLWRYRRPRPAGANVPHETSRGVALLRRQGVLRRRRSRRWSRWTPRPAAKSGPPPSPITSPATTSRSLR